MNGVEFDDNEIGEIMMEGLKVGIMNKANEIAQAAVDVVVDG